MRPDLEQPRFQHDCDDCTFLGRFEDYDLYHCDLGVCPTVIARFGDEGPQYTSSIWIARQGTVLSLAEALRRAVAKGLNVEYDLKH